MGRLKEAEALEWEASCAYCHKDSLQGGDRERGDDRGTYEGEEGDGALSEGGTYREGNKGEEGSSDVSVEDSCHLAPLLLHSRPKMFFPAFLPFIFTVLSTISSFLVFPAQPQVSYEVSSLLAPL